jgi:hypothetical protein
MAMQSVRRVLLPSAAAAALFVSSQLALAASPYDGQWVIDLPSSSIISRSDDSACPAVRFPIAIRDGQVFATLTRVPSRDGGVIVEAGGGIASAPVTGMVQADGTVEAQWQNYHATGKLDGDAGEVTVNGECGPRTGQAIRVEK